MKRIISTLLLAVMLIATLSLAACGGDGEVYEISFAEANSVNDMKKHDGEQVAVIGYMSTLSPVDGSFIYLMNAPYQSCPYCIPNTTQLSNTLAVYAKKGKSIEFTDLLVRIEGTLEFGEFTDEYGYSYDYRIKDATYTTVSADDLTEEQKLWQQLAATGAVSEVFNEMYKYLYFVCYWGTYTANFAEGKDYLYPSDATGFLVTDGAQYNYGYKSDYFSTLIARIEEVDKDAFSGLIEEIRKAEKLARDAEAALAAGEYEYVAEYSEIFGDGRKQYKLIYQDKFGKRLDDIFYAIAAWNEEWTLK